MRLDFAPGTNAASIDGLANLFAAGGPDSPLGLMEIHASALKWQADVVQELSDLGFRITNHMFVLQS